MEIAISATNPCHLYEMAQALNKLNLLQNYFSGYPKCKLDNTEELSISTYSWRTNVVYGARKYIPKKYRPSDSSLFKWQDDNFDEWVSKKLTTTDFFHAMPGQCIKSFQSAKKLGIKTVLNHATGPMRQTRDLLTEEYRRVGINIENETIYKESLIHQQEEEMALADYHAVASSNVKEQLVEAGIDQETIWVIPYGVDGTVFSPSYDNSYSKTGNDTFKIVFAGMLSVRKGIKTLLDSLDSLDQFNIEMHFYGMQSSETEQDIRNYTGKVPLVFHGNVSRKQLAKEFNKAHLLVLPSFEEGFGLVVPQALTCGLPCIVTEAVGSKDLIDHQENGSIIPTGDSLDLANEISWWITNWHRPKNQVFDWMDSAKILKGYSTGGLKA